MSQNLRVARFSRRLSAGLFALVLALTALTPPVAAVPNPAITSVNYPSSVQVGNPIQVTVTGTNAGTQAVEGDLQINFPSIASAAAVTVDSYTTPNLQTRSAGDTIWYNYGTSQTTASYAFVNAYAAPWNGGSTYSLTVTVTAPSSPGTFTFHVKLNMCTANPCSGPGDWAKDPASGTTDQQAEYVYVYTMQVVAAGALVASAAATPLVGDVPLIVAFSCSAVGGTSPYAFSWEFGDGALGLGATPTHTYEPSVSTSFFARCLVRDSSGGEAIANAPAIAVTVAPGADSDADGLSDAWENQEFGNLAQGSGDDFDGDGLSNGDELNLNTSPIARDTDGDGIWDGVEVHQRRFDLSYSNPAVIDLDLNDDGASDATPLRRDLFLEADWMADNWDLVSWNSLYSAFDRHFVFLHVLRSERLAPVALADRAQRVAYYNDNFSSSQKGVFHYAVLGDGLDLGSFGRDRSGVSSGIPGDSVFVAAGLLSRLGYGSQAITGTLLHEVGHNLGLQHFGDVASPEDSQAYISVMSYHYQLRPDRWPVGWNGLPNLGNKTGWDDWERLVFPITQNGDNPLLGGHVVDARVEPFLTISHVAYRGRMTNGTYAIESTITFLVPGTEVTSAYVYYRVQDEAQWSRVPLTNATYGGPAVGFIPEVVPETAIDYYVEVLDNQGHGALYPGGAPNDYLTFVSPPPSPGHDGGGIWSSPVVYLGIAVVAGLMILFAVLWRRRNRGEEEEPDSEL